jgi:purine-binding chemotaxis protein CheW
MATKQLCTFRLADHLYGIGLQALQEVTRHLPLTPVPASQPWVAGLLSLRGHIITALDLRTRLALPPRAQDQKPMNVVVLHDKELVCLLVDSISDIIFVDEEDFCPPPSTLDHELQTFIAGAYKLEKELVVEIDLEQILQASI